MIIEKFITKRDGRTWMAFNTGRKYSPAGQRIICTNVGDETILFLDVDRKVSGIIMHSNMDPDEILSDYDKGHHSPPSYKSEWNIESQYLYAEELVINSFFMKVEDLHGMEPSDMNDHEFATYLRGIDSNWTHSHVGEYTQFLCHGKIEAVVKYKNDHPIERQIYIKATNENEIRVKFEGIDDWNRPVFRREKSKERYGSVNILFPYCEEEKSVLEKVSEKDLDYFGNSFNCEPMGTSVENLKIV